MSQSAIFMRIAAIIGYGKNMNHLLKRSNEKISVKTHIRKAEYLFFQPDWILRDVLTKTAVTGSQPKMPEAILAMARPNTSFCLEYLSFVML